MLARSTTHAISHHRAGPVIQKYFSYRFLSIFSCFKLVLLTQSRILGVDLGSLPLTAGALLPRARIDRLLQRSVFFEILSIGIRCNGPLLFKHQLKWSFVP